MTNTGNGKNDKSLSLVDEAVFNVITPNNCVNRHPEHLCDSGKGVPVSHHINTDLSSDSRTVFNVGKCPIRTCFGGKCGSANNRNVAPSFRWVRVKIERRAEQGCRL